LSVFFRHFPRLLLLLWFPTLAMLVGCTPGRETAATIDGEIITRSEVAERLKSYHAENLLPEEGVVSPQPDAFISARTALEQLINERLLLLEAKRLGLDKPLAGKRRDKNQLIRLSLIRIGRDVVYPTLKEAENYYEQHQEEFTVKPRYLLEHLLLDSENAAWELKEQLEAGSLTMAEAGTRLNHGAPGDKRPVSAEELPPRLAKILPSLQPGEISPVIASTYGYHLIRIEKKLPAGKIPFAEAENQIKDKLYAARLQENYHSWLSQCREQHTIKIYHQHLTDL